MVADFTGSFTVHTATNVKILQPWVRYRSAQRAALHRGVVETYDGPGRAVSGPKGGNHLHNVKRYSGKQLQIPQFVDTHAA